MFICWVLPQPGCYRINCNTYYKSDFCGGRASLTSTSVHTCVSDPSVGLVVFVAMTNCTARAYWRPVPGGMCTGWAWHTSASIKHSSVEMRGVRGCTLWLGTRNGTLAHHGSLRYKCGCMGSRKSAICRDPIKRDVADRGATVSNVSGDTEPRGAQ